MKLHHIGIVVNNIQETKEKYKKIFNIKTDMEIHEDKNMKVKLLFFNLGDISIELIQPTQESGISRFLKNKGEGLHHLAYEVNNLTETIKTLKENKANIVLEPTNAYEGKVAFIHPKETGILIEFVEVKKNI